MQGEIRPGQGGAVGGFGEKRGCYVRGGKSGYLGLGAITGICEKGRLCHTGIEVWPGEVDAGSLGGRVCAAAD